MESVATSSWNPWPHVHGIDGHMRVDYSARFAPDRDTTAAIEDTADFLPIEIEGAAWSSELPSTPNFPRPPERGAVISAHRVDITLSDGRRILVEGPTALSSVLGLVQGLTA